MRERGILMSGAMVRAILAGRKTQTRRAVRVPKVCPDCIAAVTPHPNGDGGAGLFGSAAYLRVRACDHGAESVLGDRVRCPYGQPGDRLWVRETTLDDGSGGPGNIHYRADANAADLAWVEGDGRKWTPSLLMPRSRCRITLAVESIRVERAQAISDADIEAEGVDAEAVEALWDAATTKRKVECGPVGSLMSGGDDIDAHDMEPRMLWQTAWTLINGRESWDANPWVWVVSFRRTP